METLTTAYSRKAMRSLLALDQRARMQAVAKVEALVEQTAARQAAAADPMEQNGEVANPPEPTENGEDSATEISGIDNEDEDEIGSDATPDGDSDGNHVQISMLPYGGSGDLHLVDYGETGDLVVAIKDTSITVMALIDVAKKLKRGADHD